MKNYNSKFKIIFIFLIAILILSFGFFEGFAATNIDSVNRYAWNDIIGWFDFYSTDTVNVSSTELTGYASSSVGEIALNCNSTSAGNICATSNFKISNNGNGYLSGWAWNESVGWISFDSATGGASPTSTYQVIVDPTTGDFSGWAWNESVGWISFNCNNPGTSCPPNYKVKTGFVTTPLTGDLTSSIFDTQVNGGGAFNSIIWQGALNGGSVKFQIASSNATSTWDYFGPDGSSSSYYGVGIDANNSTQINLSYHNNHRYFRYKIILESNAGKTTSPRVDDIIINWSP